MVAAEEVVPDVYTSVAVGILWIAAFTAAVIMAEASTVPIPLWTKRGVSIPRVLAFQALPTDTPDYNTSSYSSAPPHLTSTTLSKDAGG